MAGVLLAADTVANTPPWRKLEGDNILLSPIGNDKEYAARRCHGYQCHIQS